MRCQRLGLFLRSEGKEIGVGPARGHTLAECQAQCSLLGGCCIQPHDPGSGPFHQQLAEPSSGLVSAVPVGPMMRWAKISNVYSLSFGPWTESLHPIIWHGHPFHAALVICFLVLRSTPSSLLSCRGQNPAYYFPAAFANWPRVRLGPLKEPGQTGGDVG